jgi:hypothetical protein
MPTGTFLTSLLSKTSLEMWRALLGGSPDGCPHRSGPRPGRRRSVEPAPDHIEEYSCASCLNRGVDVLFQVCGFCPETDWEVNGLGGRRSDGAGDMV